MKQEDREQREHNSLQVISEIVSEIKSGKKSGYPLHILADAGWSYEDLTNAIVYDLIPLYSNGDNK